MNIMEKAAELLRNRIPFALATVVNSKGSTPRSTAAKMIVLRDGSIYDTIGGGIVEAKVIAEAVEAIAEGKPRMLNYRLNSQSEGGLPMLCGGDLDVFIDVYGSVPHVVIIGGGHVGYAVARCVKLLNWEYSVIEERVEFASGLRFTDAKAIYNVEDIEAIEKLDFDQSTYVVIVTKDHDLKSLKQVVMKDAGYIGMIGSKRKVAIVMKELAGQGIPEERLGKVHAPVGLDIGAETPEEIAISITAEMIKISRSGTGKSLMELR